MHTKKLVTLAATTLLLASCYQTNGPAAPVMDNDSFSAPQLLTIGQGVDGVIAGQPRDVDYFAFDGVAGDKLRLTVKAPAGSTLDPYVKVLMPDGRTILEKDDDSGAGADSDLRFNILTPGRYTIVLTSFDIATDTKAQDNKASNLYRLDLTRR